MNSPAIRSPDEPRWDTLSTGIAQDRKTWCDQFVDIPDTLWEQVKAAAGVRGQSPESFVAEAIREKLAKLSGENAKAGAWMQHFGADKEYSDAIREIDRVIAEEFV
jgi:hypothetical protein